MYQHTKEAAWAPKTSQNLSRNTSGEGFKKISKALKIPQSTKKSNIKKVESAWRYPPSAKLWVSIKTRLQEKKTLG